MSNYAPNLPFTQGNVEIQDAPLVSSVQAIRSSENATASSVISLTHNTTALEIAAVGGTGYVRWVRTTDTEASVINIAGTANFGHVIPSGQVRRFIVPIERHVSAPGSIQGVNRALGLYQRIAWKTQGPASILATEF